MMRRYSNKYTFGYLTIAILLVASGVFFAYPLWRATDTVEIVTSPPAPVPVEHAPVSTTRLASKQARRQKLQDMLYDVQNGNVTQTDSIDTRIQVNEEEIQEMSLERADLQQQLADLRADTDYWKQQRAVTAEKYRFAQTARVQQLQEDISRQQNLVESLQDRAPASIDGPAALGKDVPPPPDDDLSPDTGESVGAAPVK